VPDEYVDAFFGFFIDGTLDESPVYQTVEEVTGSPPRTPVSSAAEPLAMPDGLISP
jgi:hypothetical protein